MLLRIDGEPLVHRAARRAIAGGIDPLIVVVGHEADHVRAVLADLPCTFAHNPAPSAATSGSLHRGLERLSPDAVGAVVLLADMVDVTSAMIRSVCDAATTTSVSLVASRYGEVLAPPHFFRRTLFPELLSWSGEGAGRGVVRRHLRDAVVLDWPVDTLIDLDTPDDLEARG